MAIRVRNVALEGFAGDFIDPLTIALVGLVAIGIAVSVSIAETSPAQVDVVECHAEPLPFIPAGPGIYIPRRVATRTVDHPIILARIACESPAQTDRASIEVRDPVEAKQHVERKRAKPAKKRRAEVLRPVAVLASVSVAVSDLAPAQGESMSAAVMVYASIASESPAQSGSIATAVYREDRRGSFRKRRVQSAICYRDRP